jgi:DNA repair photolyase
MRWLPDEPQLALFGPEQRELPSVEYMAVNARRIINTLPASSRMPFRHTINVYRGCRHACTYCFARPTHEYLGLNSGEDFERRIVVKVNASRSSTASWRTPPERRLDRDGTNTDPLPAGRGHYRLTRGWWRGRRGGATRSRS